MTDDDDDASEWTDDGRRPQDRPATLPAAAQGDGDPSDPETWRDTRGDPPDPTRRSQLGDFATEERPERPLGETPGDSEAPEGGAESEENTPGQCVALSASTGEQCQKAATDGRYCSTHARMDPDDVDTVVETDDDPTPRELDEDTVSAVTRREE